MVFLEAAIQSHLVLSIFLQEKPSKHLFKQVQHYFLLKDTQSINLITFYEEVDSVFDELVEVVAENVDMSLADDMLVVSGVDDGLQEDEKEGEEVFKG